jgi:hypothetical protein
VSGDEGIIFCGGNKAGGEPNEEVFLWRWGSSGQAPSRSSSEATGNAKVLSESPPPTKPLLSADPIIGVGVYRIYSTMPAEYDARFYFKMDMADRARLVWVGPSTWSLDAGDPYRQWDRQRNARGHVCRAGIPPVAGTADGVTAADYKSGRYFAVVESTAQLFVFHSCDAPARIVPVVCPASPAAAALGGSQMTRTLPLGQRPLVPSTPPNPRTSTGRHPNFDPRMHVEPPPPLPKVPMFRTTLLPPKKPRPGGGGREPLPAVHDALDPAKEQAILIGVLRKSKLQVAQPILESLRDKQSTVLNLSSCMTLVPDEFVLMREVVGRFPHFTTLVLPTTMLVSKLFLDALRPLKSITEVEFPESEMFVSSAALDELQTILEDHQAASEVHCRTKSSKQHTKEMCKERKQKIRMEKHLRCIVREQIVSMLDELLGRLQLEQMEARCFLMAVQLAEYDATLHNYVCFLAVVSLGNEAEHSGQPSSRAVSVRRVTTKRAAREKRVAATRKSQLNSVNS